MAEDDRTETYLALTALVVALCSLLITTGQLLGQYFATADGYRRCQPSVMGPWAKRTRLRWRWAQFRFEVLYSTPDIFLHEFGVDASDLRLGNVPGAERITGSLESESGTMIAPHSFSNPSDEMVCWLPLLAVLHQHEREMQPHGCYKASYDKLLRHDRFPLAPALTIRERSWDFMSPDIVRPFATTNISDIGVLARRLGMTWVDFRPDDGVLRAEGKEHMITSTTVRSIGIVLQYMRISARPSSLADEKNERYKAVKDELYIPVREADAMGFGVLPGFDPLGVPEYRIGTIDDVLATMDLFDSSGSSSNTIKDIRRIVPRVTFGFSDLIPFASPMIRLRGSTVIRIPIPSEYSVGLTCHVEGFVIFHRRLREYKEARNGLVSCQTDWVLQRYEELRDQFPMWEDEVQANRHANSRHISFLEKVHDCWDEATKYFIRLQEQCQSPSARFQYVELMGVHIVHAIHYWNDAWEHLRGQHGKAARLHYGLRNWIAEGAHVYFDYLPDIVEDMRRKGFDDEDVVHEAWFTMMFRAFCWWRCHYMVPGQDMIHNPSILPSRYWNSQLPVYIG